MAGTRSQPLFSSEPRRLRSSGPSPLSLDGRRSRQLGDASLLLGVSGNRAAVSCAGAPGGSETCSRRSLLRPLPRPGEVREGRLTRELPTGAKPEQRDTIAAGRSGGSVFSVGYAWTRRRQRDDVTCDRGHARTRTWRIARVSTSALGTVSLRDVAQNQATSHRGSPQPTTMAVPRLSSRAF